MVCFGMDFVCLFFFRICSASRFSTFMFLAKFGKFLVIISSSTFSASPFWFCLSRTPITGVLDPTDPRGSVLLFFYFFSSLFSLCCSSEGISIALSWSALILFSAPSALLLNPSNEFWVFKGFFYYYSIFHFFTSSIFLLAHSVS